MTSAFKNFFITFVICLLIFGFLGFQYVLPWLKDDVLDFSGMGPQNSETVSEEVSQEESQTISTPVEENYYNENGDTFTAVILCVDNENRPLNIVFIDSNEKTKQFIYCTIDPKNVKWTNEIGVSIPVGDLFTTLTPAEIAKCVSAMTGIETEYCLRFTRDDLATVASVIPGASVTLSETITFTNPAYEDYVAEPGVPEPSDYYINITNVDGKVLLNQKNGDKTNLEWLLGYVPGIDGKGEYKTELEADEVEYTAQYSSIAKSLIRQFFVNETATMSSEVMAKIIGCCETNLSVNDASNHLSTIFSYDDFNRHEVDYKKQWNSWEKAVIGLRELDGSYNK